MNDFDENILIYQDDFNQDEKPFMPENYVKAGVPFLTSYSNLFGRKSPFWYVKDDTFVGIHFKHIQLSFFYTTLHVLLISSFFIFKYQVYDYYFDELNSYFYFILVLYILLLISMFRTIFTNPYLPFFYPAQTDRKEFTQDEYRLGFAYKKEQIDWAKKQQKPNRISFSEKVGYFVVRADHYCSWVQNWIGSKNHRFFFLFIIFSAIYFDVLFLHCIHMIIYHRKLHSFLCFSFMTCNACFFGFLFTLQVFLQCNNITHNITTLEIIKHQIVFYDRGCFNNWSEVCGSKKLICLWPFPCISLSPGINVYNYPEYTGPSIESKQQSIMNENDKKDDKLFNENIYDDKNENPNNSLSLL